MELEMVETQKYVASQYAKVCLTAMVNLLDLSPKCAELDFWIFGFFFTLEPIYTGCLTLKCAIVYGSEGWKDQ